MERDKEELDVMWEKIAHLQNAVIQIQGIVFELQQARIDAKIEAIGAKARENSNGA